MMVRVFANGPGDRGSILGGIIPKPSGLTLSIIRYESRVKGSNPGNGVVAIEKGAFWSPSTTVANFTYLFSLQLWINSRTD